ncbi:MAG TPA: hypothetical protein VFT22_33290 [Kofleriaceae bacterium]|nr:hypothetical protein [Kofleriaceae bacterium]
MTFHPFSIRLDPWQTDYGSEVAALDATVDAAELDLAVEQPGAWSPIAPPADAASGAPAIIYFVDGVRRVDARIVGRRQADRLFHGAFGSYAVGAVEAEPRRRLVRFATAAVDRVVATGAGEQLPETVRVNHALAYRPVSTKKTEPVAPEREIHDQMRCAEERMARALAEHDALVVTDGPLTFQDATRGFAVGWIKRIEELYLPGSHAPVLRALAAGARTPLFALRSSNRFARYSWFLRLTAPRRGDSELSGLVRCEVAAHVGVARAVVLANATARLLPPFAGIRGLHARAPQNLLPIAALEARLRRELGDARLLSRYVEARIAEQA